MKHQFAMRNYGTRQNKVDIACSTIPQNPPHPPLSKGRRKKIEIIPLTLPSPSRGEGEHNEIRKETSSPLRGEDLGGGENGIFSHLQGGKGGFDAEI
jgi:hypothetical protein